MLRRAKTTTLLCSFHGGHAAAVARSNFHIPPKTRSWFLQQQHRQLSRATSPPKISLTPRYQGVHVVAIGNGTRPVATLSPSFNGTWNRMGYRWLSSDNKNNKQQQESKKEDGDSQEIVLTPGEQVVAASRLGMWTGIGIFALCCAYYIGRELFPTKMSPNVVFNRALDVVREHPDVKRRFGESLKGYGRDHGGHREGRRNFIEHTEYKNEDDGTKRTRVRFNLEGRFGHAFVFAEVSSGMPSGEFVYVLVQDKANGQVITVVDNRARLAAARLSGGTKEGTDAMNALLGGGRKN